LISLQNSMLDIVEDIRLICGHRPVVARKLDAVGRKALLIGQ